MTVFFDDPTHQQKQAANEKTRAEVHAFWDSMLTRPALMERFVQLEALDEAEAVTVQQLARMRTPVGRTRAALDVLLAEDSVTGGGLTATGEPLYYLTPRGFGRLCDLREAAREERAATGQGWTQQVLFEKK